MLAYFGPQGTFTEQAARAFSAADPAHDDLVPFDTVPAALAAARRGEVDAACVPVENSVEGAVPATMDALTEGDPLVAVAETVLDVRFSVLVRPGAGEPKTIASHPHALAQVRHWIAENLPTATAVATTSTAAAARAVLAGEFDAAVSAPVAVRHYPLEVLATDVADVRDAKTRFLLLRRPGPLPRPTGHDRTSVVVTATDRIGALSDLLAELALRRINLTRIESRPTKGRLGEYRFYIDLDGHAAEPGVGDALAALRRHCPDTRFLGSYPKAEPVLRAEAGARAEPGGSPAADEFVAAAEWVASLREGLGA
ncbi:prephenate dehydratase [Actinosynnema sp. NPDC047251]|uniref:Prephenate dehydratase n=1 Tax=Saccharothrix espanaensis (strain ATCC 51144 / DSM 44229 / JCM 9112 / NBRC 15066 / NRRL 15764) TaxID=1179773 RepID=K0JRN5_SACES|nr:prephenate dehydratase [Saccharothrix espanaensis]CCH27469.1 Prephenate dehydratase [Saccharothrix espanaensis DSM 44229]